MSEPPELTRAKRTRKGHRSSVTRTIAKVDEELHGKPDGPDPDKLGQFQETLQAKRATLQAIHEIIIDQVEEDSIEDEIEQFDIIEERIGLCLCALKTALTSFESKERSAVTPPSTKSHTTSADATLSGRLPTPEPAVAPTVPDTVSIPAPPAPRIKLPKLTLQKFNGDISKWLPFWNQFDSSIHSNTYLHDVDKFNYLVSYLEGEAAECIRGMAITTANYPQAVARLQERFGDNQRVIDQHMELLLHLPSVKDHLDLQGLRRFSDTLATNIAGLRALGEREEFYSKVISPVIMSRLPTEIQLSIGKELEAATRDMSRLTTAINREIATRERYVDAAKRKSRSPTPPRRLQHQPTVAAFLANSKDQCPFCGKEHLPTACTKISSPSARANVLKKQGRCFNCFRRNHLSKQCKAPERCSKCRGKHHTALCRDGEARGQANNNNRGHGGGNRQQQQQEPPQGGDAVQTQNLYAGSNSSVLLQTATMSVYNPDMRSSPVKKIRAILDSGSQRSYLTEAVARDLKLNPKKTESLRIKTFGDSEDITQTCPVVDLAIQTSYRNTLKMELLVVPSICDSLSHQPTTQAKETHPHLRGLKLADPNTMEDKLPIDLLIGSDNYWSLVTGNTKRGKSGPTAIQTKVGWVLSGATGMREDTTTSANLLFTTTHLLRVQTTTMEDNLDAQLKKFWDLETLGIQMEENTVQDKFTQTITRQGGRYQVKLPWKPTHRPLPTNLDLCQKRLQSLLKKLRPQPELLQEYDKVIQEQVGKGIVEIVPEEEHCRDDRVHYLPHHAVIRRDKSTTKLRVVYDASAKTHNNPSLNDCLYTGPTFDQSIMDILIRFRLHPIAMIADIEKAFLMVSVAPEDRNALRFLWTSTSQQDPAKLLHLRFTRVTFGVNCSPFLLNATIDHHIRSYQESDPCFVKTFLRSIYVDDVSFGAQSEDEAYQLFTKAKFRLAEAGFNLRKFASNSTSLQQQVDAHEDKDNTPATTKPEEDLSFAQTTLGVKGEKGERGGEHRVLGVRWNSGEDKLVFDLESLKEQLRQEVPTKREVIGVAAKIFDPLGVMSPVTVSWKMLFQATCKAGLGWDQALGGECLREWKRLKTAMEEETTTSVPRCYQIDNSKKIRLIGFCDASEKAYAAVVYLRIGEEEADIHFVAAKTRVAPTKPTTIPRLELLSALLLTKLCQSVETALKDSLPMEKTLCYTDSRVALYWIVGQDREWKQFVENRVNAIRQLVPSNQWRHCPGASNPADIPSRGMNPKDLKNSTIWLQGPEWLRHSLEPEVEKREDIPEECLAERKKSHTLVALQENSPGLSQLIDPEEFSTLRRLLNTTAAVLKFTHLTRRRRKGQVELLQEARALWTREAQEELLREGNFRVWQKQLNLQPNEEGLWRCVGRLKNSSLDANARAPIIVSRRHHFTKLLVRDAHRRVTHNGVKETLTELRTRYWILKGRQTVKKEIHRCPVCRRHEGGAYGGIPAPPLPVFRVQPHRPFSSVGVDFAGPLYLKGETEVKAWLCLYTCCTTRAVHLDLVPDLSTNTFVRSFRRFCARRGTPSLVVTDNAKTFKKADQALQSLMEKAEMENHLADRGIQWKFNVEKAPWQGGFFERMVKSAKRCLKKSIGKQALTYEELLTLVIEVEAVLNSRPLSYVAEDDTEEPLTPSHLMTGHRVLSLPDPTACGEKEDPDFQLTSENLPGRMKHLTAIKEKFWRRWKQEYLQELREQHRSQSTPPGVKREIQEGEPVIIYDEAQPRGLWRLGRILELIHSNDGETRAARIKVISKTGRPTTLKRPIQHLYPLEIGEPSKAVEQKEETQKDKLTRDEPTDSDQAAPQHDPDQVTDQTQDTEEDTQMPRRERRPTRLAAQRAQNAVRELAAQNLT